MRTLLLRPFTDSSQGRNPPLALMYLSAYLKSQKLDVCLFDTCVDVKLFDGFSRRNSYLQQLLRDIDAYSPDIIGMTLFSRELQAISVLCTRLKEAFPAMRVVLGGPHPTVLPQQTLEQVPGCDIVARGEGELILHDLIQGYMTNQDLRNVQGISFREGPDHIHHNADADVIRDLDSLPFPDKESVIEHYHNGTYAHILYGMPTDSMITSRGCPFQCKFCFKVCSIYRSRSPENVLQEIDWLVNHIAPEYIQIMDDSFTIQRRRSLAILEGMIERRYPCKFKVRSRVNAVDEEILRMMKQAGVVTIVYGFESGSQKMLDAFCKQTTVEQNMTTCRFTKKHGLNCLGDMIVFYPGETRETLRETERFLKHASPHAVKFAVLTPLPNTAVYKEAQKNGTLVGDWNIGDQTPWVKLDNFDGIEDMQRIAKKMFVTQFLDPARLWWLLRSYGKSFVKHPVFFFKMMLNTFLKKTKY